MNQRGLSKGKKIIIISLLSVFVVLLAVVAILLSIKHDPSRTIMIYMDGTDLETRGLNATGELNGIDPREIDFNNYHILLYTGGTKKWHNFASPSENAIYELTANGFVKVKSMDKKNMGDAATLTEFLEYGYTNYPAGNYDLMIWDHGSGSIGAVHDELSGDYMHLDEFETALRNSPFNSNNKLQNIVFETCLNGSLEFATVLAPYANYLVASEEVTNGTYVYSELVFLGRINEIGSSYKFAEEFVNGYADKMDFLNAITESVDTTSTYSVIDLNQIPKLNQKLDDFYKSINVESSYNAIARARAGLYQFAVETADCYDYDTVDLYEFVASLEGLNSAKARDIENFIKNKVVLYNWTKTPHANGLSVYIPYNSSSKAVDAHMTTFSNTSLSDSYIGFIQSFNNAKKAGIGGYTYRLTENEITSEKTSTGKEFKLKLDDDQIKNFGRASYIIFKKESDGYFTPVYKGTDAKLDDDGYITTNLTNNLIAVVDEEINEKSLFLTLQMESSEDGIRRYRAPIQLNKIDEDYNFTISTGVMNLSVDKNNQVKIDTTYVTGESSDSLFTIVGETVSLDDYSSIDFMIARYKILDDNGNYTTDWGLNGTSYRYEVKKGKYHFEVTSLEDGDYYCIFEVYDVQNQPNYSNLISIN